MTLGGTVGSKLEMVSAYEPVHFEVKLCLWGSTLGSQLSMVSAYEPVHFEVIL